MSTHHNTPGSQHQYWSPLHPSLQADEKARFFELVSDITAGVALCLEIAHMSNFSRENGYDPSAIEPPMLDLVDTEHIIRFSIAATKMLKEKADKGIERMNQCAKEQGGAHE